MQNLCLSSQKCSPRDLLTFFLLFQGGAAKKTYKQNCNVTYLPVSRYCTTLVMLTSKYILSLSPPTNQICTNDNCHFSPDSSILRRHRYFLVSPPCDRRATGPTSARFRRWVSSPSPNYPATRRLNAHAVLATPSTISTFNSVREGTANFCWRW